MNHLKLFEYWKGEFETIGEFEFRNLKSTDFFSKQIMNKYLLINPKVREILKYMGLKIVVFDGRLTLNKELLTVKRVVPKNWPKDKTWSAVDGMYAVDEKIVFVSKTITYYDNGKKITYNGRDIFLHEVGHAIDHLIGDYLYGQDISSLREIRRLVKKEPFNDYYYDGCSSEYIANSFDLYYKSKESRNRLEEDHPGIFNIISGVEKEL